MLNHAALGDLVRNRVAVSDLVSLGLALNCPVLNFMALTFTGLSDLVINCMVRQDPGAPTAIRRLAFPLRTL